MELPQHDGWLTPRSTKPETAPQLHYLVTLPDFSGWKIQAALVTERSSCDVSIADGLPDGVGITSRWAGF